jgi:hypothetical protein
VPIVTSWPGSAKSSGDDSEVLLGQRARLAVQVPFAEPAEAGRVQRLQVVGPGDEHRAGQPRVLGRHHRSHHRATADPLQNDPRAIDHRPPAEALDDGADRRLGEGTAVVGGPVRAAVARLRDGHPHRAALVGQPEHSPVDEGTSADARSDHLVPVQKDDHRKGPRPGRHPPVDLDVPPGIIRMRQQLPRGIHPRRAAPDQRQ